MKFLPEVGAGTRILKVKLPGFDHVRIPRKKRSDGIEGRRPEREGRRPEPDVA